MRIRLSHLNHHVISFLKYQTRLQNWEQKPFLLCILYLLFGCSLLGQGVVFDGGMRADRPSDPLAGERMKLTA